MAIFPSAHPARKKVLCAGICSLILAMGVARFAYTPLLPLMRAQAGLSVVGAGWLATVNYSGYLLGALLSSLITDIVLKDRLYRAGMIVAVFSTALMAVSGSFGLWAVSRFIAGLSSAAGMLLGSGLTFNWLMRHGQRPELGIHFAGIGIGIAVCAAAVEIMTPAWNWREQWIAFAVLGGVLLVPVLGWLPRPDRGKSHSPGASLSDRPLSARFFGTLMAAYFFAGIGFVVSATFIVAIVNALPGLAGHGTLVFLWIGLAAAPSCMFWDLLARRSGEINALILAAAVQIVGILLPVWPGGLGCAVIGGVLFGGSFAGLVSLVLTLAGRYYPTRPATMMGRMTLAYGVAQIIAPAATAWLATRSGSYATGLYAASASMVACTALLFMLKRIRPS